MLIANPVLVASAQSHSTSMADPEGPAAGEYLMEHFGLPRDEQYLPALGQLADQKPGERAKALAWQAIVRLKPTGTVWLDRAWRDVMYEPARQLLALNGAAFSAPPELAGESRTRAFIEETIRLQQRVEREGELWRQMESYAF
ncbi:MAG: hypothetical protein ABIQ65_00590 [Thermoanaerobaculia bacterium]